MVRELARKQSTNFPETAPVANPVFFRTYSRRTEEGRETWEQVRDRCVDGLVKLGQLTAAEAELITETMTHLKSLPAGRWLWVGGTQWLENPKNYSGAYNCTSTNVTDWRAFGLMMDLAMMGCGTGAVLEEKYIKQLPTLRNRLQVSIEGKIGTVLPEARSEETTVKINNPQAVRITIGDSRQGWVQSYQALLELASNEDLATEVKVIIDPSHVRPAGERLKGFGGVANPVKIPELYSRLAKILNQAQGRKLNAEECCLLIDEAAATVVAGNIRRSAGIRQFDADSPLLKQNLWQPDAEGNWRIDPDRDALRMANHTRVYHQKPSLEDCVEAVRSQFYSGEGAIQYAPEAIARGNADLLDEPSKRKAFLEVYTEKGVEAARDWLKNQGGTTMPKEEVEHRLQRYGLNPCGEIIGHNFHCVAGDTLLITRDGMDKIGNLVGQTVEIWNGKQWSRVVPVLTGRNRSLYRVSFSDGTYLDVTDQHRFFVKNRFAKAYKEVTTAELATALKTENYVLHTEPFTIQYDDGEFVEPTLAYTLGQLVGDGSICGYNDKPQLQLRLYGAKSYQKLVLAGRTSGTPRYYTETKTLPCLLYTGFDKDLTVEQVRELKYTAQPFENLASWNRDSILHFIAGLADADGSEVSSGGIRIYLSGYDRTYRVYLLLCKCGIRSSINLAAKAGSETNLGIRQKDLWYLQITDCVAIPCQRLDTSKGHKPKYKGKWQNIRACDPLEGLHDTFCFNEPEFHKGVFGGTLTGQCNLAEVHLNLIDPDNEKELRRAFQAGALSVAVLLNHHFQEPRYQYSRELDPIVGVSFTGLFDFFVHAIGVEWLRWWEEGRPNTEKGKRFKQVERGYLEKWREIVNETVWDYCDRHNIKRPNRCTTVQPSGCLTKDALRIFDQGLLYADEHMIGGEGEVNLEELNLSVRKGISVSSGIANSELDLIRVTLKNGRQITMTENHRLSVKGQWMFAIDLKEGMEIDFSLGEYSKADNPLLESVELTKTQGSKGRPPKGCKLPSRMSPELAYLIGAIFGNGCFSENKYRIRIIHGNPEVLSKLSDLGVQLFGLKGVIQQDGVNKYELCFANKQLYLFFIENGLEKNSKSKDLDRIPLPIRQSSRESILAFIAGLIDTDGHIRESGSLCINSASEAFMRSMQQVAEAVGLSFSFYSETKGFNKQEKKQMYGLSLSRMLSQGESLQFLNSFSLKAISRPIQKASRQFSFHPYQIAKIETGVVDYSFDYAVDGDSDDDSWYWQGALKSHNTKSLLTGASPGWHPPKAVRFIRRVTFGKNDPVALACIDYGYNVIPSQSDKDETGNLLHDPFDPRCTEWLVEIPVAVSWADLEGADEIDISQFSVLAQFDFAMQVQKHYVTHNTSATLELREHEIEDLGKAIYEAIQNDEGYISAALLARFDAYQSFPRLPFEPVDEATYNRLMTEVEQRRTIEDFHTALLQYDVGEREEAGPTGCDSDKCMFPDQ